MPLVFGEVDARIIPNPLDPYDPATRPWYLDQYWHLFLGTGYSATSTPTSTTLASDVALGASVIPFTSATGYVAGQVFFMFNGSAAPYTWQAFVIDSIATNNVTIKNRTKIAFTAGATIVPGWNNDTHPGTTDAYKVWAQFVADAKRSRAMCGINLLDLNVSGMGSVYTDANSEANVPIGWESLLPASTVFTSGVNGRLGNGGFYTGSALGAGLRSLADIPLKAGQQIYISALVSQDKGTTGCATMRLVDKASSKSVTDGVTTSGSAQVTSATGGFTATAHQGASILGAGIPLGATIIRVVDTNTLILSANATASASSIGFVIAKVIASQDIGSNVDAQTAMTKGQLGIPTTLRAVVPNGVTNGEIQFVQTISSAKPTMDDVRVLFDRQDSSQHRYVIEDPGQQPIVLLGDSWGLAANGGDLLHSALEARFGHTISWVNSAITGQTLSQMNARFLTDVAAYKPKYCIIEYGANDLTSGSANPQAAMELEIDTTITLCRSNGIIPVFVGLPPITSQIAIAPSRNDQVRARCDVACGAVSAVW